MESTEKMAERLKQLSYLPQESDYPPSPIGEGLNEPFEEFTEPDKLDPFLGVKRLPKGSIQFNKDDKHSFLGKGAFGQVYRGTWHKRLVALKELDIKEGQIKLGLSQEEVLEALQWETTRLSTASHPNLVQFYGLYEEDNKRYLVLEYCEQGDLKSVLTKTNPDWTKRWQWALEVAQGLAYLHHQGMLHRDLKAENILIDGNGRAKLADLGVAQVDALLQSTEARVVFKGLQDWRFAAPEALTALGKGEYISTHETDIYALGLVFWQLVTGKEPRRFKNSQDLLALMQKGEREVIPEDCPAEFKTLILKCWAFEAHRRPKLENVIESLNQLLLQSHPESHWMTLCQQTDVLIHTKRIENLSYVPSLVTEYRVQEDLDTYWRRIEQTETKSDKEEEDNNAEKSTLISTGNLPLKLKKILDEFLAKPQASTLLLLGESGLGKTLSVYQLADELLSQWWAYLVNSDNNSTPYFPIFIRPALNRWAYSELKDGLKKALESYSLQAPLVNWKEAPLLIIIDGYDECQADEEPHNLAEQLGIEEFTNVKLLVTCRPDTVAATSLAERFALQDRLTTRYFLPFSTTQLLNYLNQGLQWDEKIYKAYRDKFEQSHSLRAVLRNPFVASLFVQSWETIKEKDFNQLNRWQIYEGFVEHWIKSYHFLLSPSVKKGLTQDCKSETALKSLLESFNVFSSEIAFNAFNKESITFDKQEQEKIDFVYKATSLWLYLKEQIRKDSQRVFKERQKSLTQSGQRRALLNGEDYIKIMEWRLQQFETGSPLKNKEALCEFSHKSFFEYFVAKRIVLLREKDHSSIVQEALKLLNHRLIQTEPEAVVFLTESWKEAKTRNLIAPFFEILEYSKKENFENFKASANAITILNRARISFSGMDLSGIHIPGADLSYGIFDGTQFQGADLNNTKLHCIWINNANLSNSQMNGVNFEQKPCLIHAGRVEFLAYSPDGCYLATLSVGRISLWNNVGFFQQKLFKEDRRTHYIETLTWSPDGSKLVSVGGGFIKIWDIAKAIVDVFAKVMERTESIAWSPDGKMLALDQIKNISIWDIKNKTCIALCQKKMERVGFVKVGISFSADSSLLTAICDDEINIWNVEPWQLKFQLKLTVTCIKFSPIGKKIAMGDEKGCIKIWDLNTKEVKDFLGHKGSISSIDWNQDSLHFVSASADQTIKIWNIMNGNIQTFKGHKSSIESVSWNQKTEEIASGSSDRTVLTWSTQDRDILTWRDRDNITKFATQDKFSVLSHDGRKLAVVVASNVLYIYKLPSGELYRTLHRCTKNINKIAWHSDNNFLAFIEENNIVIWNTTNDYLNSFPLPSHVSSNNNKKMVVKSQFVGNQLITSSTICKEDEYLKIFSQKSPKDSKDSLNEDSNNKIIVKSRFIGNELVSCYSICNTISDLVWSPNGQFIAVAKQDGSIQILTVLTDRIVNNLNNTNIKIENTINCLLWDLSKNQLFLGSEQGIFILDLNTKQNRKILKEPLSLKNITVDFQRNLLAGCGKGFVYIWDLSSGEKLFYLNKDSLCFNSITFSPDGKNIAIGGGLNYGGYIHIYEISSNRCLLQLSNERRVKSISWKAEFMTMSDGNSTKTWKVITKEPFTLQLILASEILLNAKKANISNVQGLTIEQLQLLEQKGVIGAGKFYKLPSLLPVTFSYQERILIKESNPIILKRSNGKNIESIEENQGESIRLIASIKGTGLIDSNAEETIIRSSRALAQRRALGIVDENLSETLALMMQKMQTSRLNDEFIQTLDFLDNDEMIQKNQQILKTQGYIEIIEKEDLKIKTTDLTFYQEKLDKHRRLYGEHDLTIIELLDRIGMIHYSKDSHKKAFECFQKSLSIKKIQYGEQHPEIATSLNNIGAIFMLQGRYKEAFEYFQQSLFINKLYYGEQHPKIAASLNNVAEIFKFQGRYEEALESFQESLFIDNLYGNTYHSGFATTLNNIGTLYRSQGRYQEALAYYQKSLNILKNLYGESYPDVAILLNNIGLVYKYQGHYEDALDYYKQSLALKEEVNDQPFIAVLFHNIGSIYQILKHYEKALKYLQKSIDIHKNLGREQHPIIAASYMGIGNIYHAQNHCEDALIYYQESLSIRINLYGENHPEIGETLYNIGNVYRTKKFYDDALIYFKKSLVILRVFFSEQHPQVLITLESITNTLYSILLNSQLLLRFNKIQEYIINGLKKEKWKSLNPDNLIQETDPKTKAIIELKKEMNNIKERIVTEDINSIKEIKKPLSTKIETVIKASEEEQKHTFWGKRNITKSEVAKGLKIAAKMLEQEAEITIEDCHQLDGAISTPLNTKLLKQHEAQSVPIEKPERKLASITTELEALSSKSEITDNNNNAPVPALMFSNAPHKAEQPEIDEDLELQAALALSLQRAPASRLSNPYG